MCASHIHNEIEFNLVLGGALSYLFGGQLARLEAGEIGIFWGALPHQLVEIEPATELFWLTLPLSTLLGFELPSSLVQSLLRGEWLQTSGDAALETARFAAWHDDLKHGDERAVTLEVEARLRRLARELPASTQRSAYATPPDLGRVETMAAFIAQHYASDIGLPDIARAANLHPNYAATLFKREFGSTLGESLLRTRLAHAQRWLATTDKTVGEVAQLCGFGSPARFHAAFKERIGVSPRAYRLEARR